jgi:hypothetical protein
MEILVLYHDNESMSLEHGDADRGKPNYSKKNPSQYHFVHHKSPVNWPEIEPSPPS